MAHKRLRMHARPVIRASSLESSPCCEHIATYCNTLPHTATHCIILAPSLVQGAMANIPIIHIKVRVALSATCLATHCNVLQRTATHCNVLQHTVTHLVTRLATCLAPHCTAQQHTAKYCNTLQHTATHCNIIEQMATHCKALQVTAADLATHSVACLVTHSNTL